MFSTPWFPPRASGQADTRTGSRKKMLPQLRFDFESEMARSGLNNDTGTARSRATVRYRASRPRGTDVL
jgi:hypothetical protein